MPDPAGRIAELEAENAELRRRLAERRDDLTRVLAAVREGDAATRQLINNLVGQIERLQNDVSNGNVLLLRQDEHIDDLQLALLGSVAPPQ